MPSRPTRQTAGRGRAATPKAFTIAPTAACHCRRLPRPDCGAQGGRLPGHHPHRVHLHGGWGGALVQGKAARQAAGVGRCSAGGAKRLVLVARPLGGCLQGGGTCSCGLTAPAKSHSPTSPPAAALQVEEGIDALYDLIWHIESYEQVRGRGGCFYCTAGIGCAEGLLVCACWGPMPAPGGTVPGQSCLLLSRLTCAARAPAAAPSCRCAPRCPCTCCPSASRPWA